MEDFDEADDQNEEDLLLLGDDFAKIDNLSTHILNRFNEFITNKNLYKQGKAYVQYCINQLHEDDTELAKQFLDPIMTLQPKESTSGDQIQ